jgi:Fe-S-cluster-containing dehydrogenase component/DMSO reductase anchor subunit
MVMMADQTTSFDEATAPTARTLIDELLEEQRSLTATDRFSSWHEHSRMPSSTYRSLLPATAPAPGQQFAFEVDLDKCSGCKSCVTACHSLNGLDDGEAWRSVGTLVSDDWRRPLQQTVTTACHHCVDPGCLNGCPVLAYEKDPLTGIVRHLDDQCIGCQYCVLKCPYDVPKYSTARGIVRKCDLCSQRLSTGEAPACAQACPNEAIRITIVEQRSIRTTFAATATVENVFLPTAPDPRLTLPTTRYVSRNPLPQDLVPGNAPSVRLQPGHSPLVCMLVLTQLGIGAFLLNALLSPSAASGHFIAHFIPHFVESIRPSFLSLLSLAATAAGLAASVLHLGKPSKAWRSFLGWRTSWLSREIIAFNIWPPLAACATLWPPLSLSTAVRLIVAVLGLLAVICSAMVYHDTGRVFWRGFSSLGRFLGATAVLGLAAAWLSASTERPAAAVIPLALAAATTLKLSGEHRLFRRAGSELAITSWPKLASFNDWSLAQTAVLMRERLGLHTRLRFVCGTVGGVILPLLTCLPTGAPLALAGTGSVLTLVGELLERHLFFRCVVPPQMPGPELER